MSTITREFTKEQLQQIEAAAKEVMWPVVWSEKKAREHFSEKITPKVVLKLARIALASIEAEPVVSHIGSKNALDAIVAFIKSNRNPTLKDHNEVSERLFQDNCHGISNHVIEYIKMIGEELEELRNAQDSAPPAPVSVPDLTALDNLAGEMLNHAMNCERRVAVSYTHCAHRLAEEVRDLRAAMLNQEKSNG